MFFLNFSVKDGEFRITKGKRKANELIDFIEKREFDLIEVESWSLDPKAF